MTRVRSEAMGQTEGGQPMQNDQLRMALQLLLRAHDYAHDTQRDVWEFAIEIDEFLRTGISRSEMRWLACKDLVSLGREKTVSGQTRRDFQLMGGLAFSRRTCAILTPAGVEVARRCHDSGRIAPIAAPGSSTALRTKPNSKSCVAQIPCPQWDRDRHTLQVGNQLVKEYKVPSPNQETILTAFEEDGWPPRIDDPLPMVHGIEPKRRLQDTVKSLNRNQRIRLVRFMGDGTGEGVRWEFAARTSPMAVTEPVL